MGGGRPVLCILLNDKNRCFKGKARIGLRASDCIFRESRDRTENSNFLLFRPKDPFGELFSKILFKSSSEFNFLRNLRKLEIPPDPARTPNNGGWNLCEIEQFQHASTES